MTTETVELPPLPEHAAAWVIPGDDGGSLKEWVDAKAFSEGEFTAPLFTASQMREYARQAVLAERERCAKVCEDIYDDPAGNNGYDAYYTRPYLECAEAIRKG